MARVALSPQKTVDILPIIRRAYLISEYSFHVVTPPVLIVSGYSPYAIGATKHMEASEPRTSESGQLVSSLKLANCADRRRTTDYVGLTRRSVAGGGICILECLDRLDDTYLLPVYCAS